MFRRQLPVYSSDLHSPYPPRFGFPHLRRLFAICVKYSAGGIGKNLFNPAASGICVSSISFSEKYDRNFSKTVCIAACICAEAFPTRSSTNTELRHHLISCVTGRWSRTSRADYFYGIEAGAIGAVSAALLTVRSIHLFYTPVFPVWGRLPDILWVCSYLRFSLRMPIVNRSILQRLSCFRAAYFLFRYSC